MIAMLAIALVQFTGPGGQRVDVNPAEVTSVREPRAVNKQHLAAETNCVLFMADGGFIAVAEQCDTVRQKLGQP